MLNKTADIGNICCLIDLHHPQNWKDDRNNEQYAGIRLLREVEAGDHPIAVMFSDTIAAWAVDRFWISARSAVNCTRSTVPICFWASLSASPAARPEPPPLFSTTSPDSGIRAAPSKPLPCTVNRSYNTRLPRPLAVWRNAASRACISSAGARRCCPSFHRAIWRKSRERYRTVALQMGWNSADPSGRGAEGHGAGDVRRRSGDGRGALRQDHPLAPCPCPDPLDRRVEGAPIAGRQGGGHRRRFSPAEIRIPGPGAGAAEFLAHHPQRHGAREGALRGPCRRRSRGDRQEHGRRGGGAGRDRLRSIAARDRRRCGNGARCAIAVRGHDHPRRRAGAEQTLEHRQAGRICDRRSRPGLCRGRLRHRKGVQDRGRASGLYRAACDGRADRRRRPGRDLGVEPGPFCRARADREAARRRDRRSPGHRGRNRRRLWRQDHRLSRTGGGGAVAQDRPAGQDRDEPRRGVQGLGPDLGRLDVGQDRRHQGRQDHRRRRRLQVPGRRLSRLAGDERVPLRLCPL